MKKIFSLFTLTFVFALIFSGTAGAKAGAELTSVISKEVDDSVEVEINFNGKIPESNIQTKVNGSQVLVELDNTAPGRISRISGTKIEAKEFVKKISVNEVKINHTRVRISFQFPVSEEGLELELLPANKAEKKSARIVLHVKKNFKKSGAGSLDVKDKIIVIDPGHGGGDSGAVGPSGVREKDVCLSVAKKTESLLSDAGAKVIMTRTTDRDVTYAGSPNSMELQARVDKAPSNADIFVSIHCNAFQSPSASGMETYCSGRSSEGRRLAQLLNEELASAGGLLNRGVKSANFYVIRHTACPASLVELAFITNYREERLLADDEYQNTLAAAIAKAVSRFFTGS